jgi:hypothetical protein
MNDLSQTIMIFAGEYKRKLVLNNNGDHKTHSDDVTQTTTSRGCLGSRGNEKLTCDIGLVLPGKGKIRYKIMYRSDRISSRRGYLQPNLTSFLKKT